MKQLLLLVICLMSFSIAEIHPGLKNAIDKGDIKTAENLVKKIGVKDIYCPKNLSFDNAMKVYGDVFNSEPEKIWQFCDSNFVIEAENKGCKNSVPICRYYLQTCIQNNRMDLLEMALEDVLQSELYNRKEKQIIEKMGIIKTSERECKDELMKEEYEAFNPLVKKEVRCKLLYSESVCDKFNVALDSLRKNYIKREKLCKTKPTKKILKEKVDADVMVNSFLYEIEYFGLFLVKEMKNPFYFNSNFLDVYKKMKKNKKINESLVKELWYKINNDEDLLQNLAFCFAYFDETLWIGRNHLDCYTYEKNFQDGFNLTMPMEGLIDRLSSVYASSGAISDSLIAFSCRLYPQIDKELYKVKGINIIDCNIINEYSAEYKTCANNNSSYSWTSSLGNDYICKNGKFYSQDK